MTDNSEDKYDEEAYQAFCHQSGMTISQRHFMSNFASKMHKGLADKEVVTAEDIQLMMKNL